jgi:hypothetical protein
MSTTVNPPYPMQRGPHRLVVSRLAQISSAPLAQYAAWIVVAIVFAFIPRVYPATRPAGNDLMVYSSLAAPWRAGESLLYSIETRHRITAPTPLRSTR